MHSPLSSKSESLSRIAAKRLQLIFVKRGLTVGKQFVTLPALLESKVQLSRGNLDVPAHSRHSNSFDFVCRHDVCAGDGMGCLRALSQGDRGGALHLGRLFKLSSRGRLA